MRTVDERTASQTDVMKALKDSIMADLRVAMPGIVRDWDEEQQTVTVQLAIREKVSSGGMSTEVDIPLLVDVPVVMPSAGGYGLYFAPEPGDECLVVFADTCIDAWWQSGGVQSQADKRRHDLSDAFAIMGCWSQTNKPNLKKIEDGGMCLQNNEGTAGILISGNTVKLFGHVEGV